MPRRTSRPSALAVVGSVSTLALVGALSTAALTTSAGAETAGSHGRVPLAAKADPNTLVQGLVADARTGRFLDDVDVRAVTTRGAIMASAFTYASQRADGPQHGYYYLHAPAGTYDVQVRAAGYRTTTVEDVRVVTHRRTTLDLVELVRLKTASRTTLAAGDRTLTTKQPGRLTLRVASASGRPTGVVTVRERSKVVARVRLDAGRNGVAQVGLGRLAAGRHTFTASYAGTPELKASTSRPVTITVARSGRSGDGR